MKSSVLDRDLADLVLNKSERLRIFLGVITDAHENLRRITLKSFLKKFSATEYCRHSGSTSVVFREMVDVLREHTSCKEVQAWVAEAEPLLPHSKEKLRKRIEFHKREVKRLYAPPQRGVTPPLGTVGGLNLTLSTHPFWRAGRHGYRRDGLYPFRRWRLEGLTVSDEAG